MTEQFEQAMIEATLRSWWTPGPDADDATRERWTRLTLEFARPTNEMARNDRGRVVG